MTTISTTQKKHLNNMNRAAQDVQLGTMLSDLITSASATTGTAAVQLAALPSALSSGSHAVVASELLGTSTITFTGFSGIKGFILQNRRSGSSINTEIDATIVGNNVVVKSGSLVVTTSASSTLVAGDALYCMGF